MALQERVNQSWNGNEIDSVRRAIDQVLAIAITDPDGIITYVNDRFCQLYRYSREEVIGKSHRLLKSGRHSDEFYRKLWQTISSGKLFTSEIVNRTKDGEERWAYMVIVPFLDAKGKPYQYVSFRTDITPTKLKEAAEAAVQARDRVVSMAAHELKTPITSLQLILDLLRRRCRENEPSLSRADIEEVARLVGICMFQTNRLTSIINDLLDVSRIAAGKLELNSEMTDLRDLLRNLLAQFRQDFESAGCEVHLEAPDSVIGDWDRARIEQVVINLVSNAMKYGRGRPIVIGLSSDGSTATICVQDRGIGIPKEFQERLFQRFERADAARDYKGVGLGLWISSQIVAAHGGKIRVESEVGKGSTFFVDLPVRLR